MSTAISFLSWIFCGGFILAVVMFTIGLLAAWRNDE